MREDEPGLVPSLPQMTISLLGWALWELQLPLPICSLRGLHMALLAPREDQCLCYRPFSRWSQMEHA